MDSSRDEKSITTEVMFIFCPLSLIFDENTPARNPNWRQRIQGKLRRA